jgi:cytochrome c5
MDPRIIVCIVLLTASSSAPAQDPRRGVALYENHCTSCHDSVAHERKHRKADSWWTSASIVSRNEAASELALSGVGIDAAQDATPRMDQGFPGFNAR